MLAGLPLVTVDRAAGAIFLAATDESPDAQGALYTLPDERQVLRVPHRKINDEMYNIMEARLLRVVKSVSPSLWSWPRPLLELLPGQDQLWLEGSGTFGTVSMETHGCQSIRGCRNRVCRSMDEDSLQDLDWSTHSNIFGSLYYEIKLRFGFFV